ncbi:MAG: hypothetical protein HY242_16500 [Afipia sp.]|nr:hypothetical protein [Afipia sp.]
MPSVDAPPLTHAIPAQIILRIFGGAFRACRFQSPTFPIVFDIGRLDRRIDSGDQESGLDHAQFNVAKIRTDQLSCQKGTNKAEYQ